MFKKAAANRAKIIRTMVVEYKKWEAAFFSDEPYRWKRGGELFGYEADSWVYNYWDSLKKKADRKHSLAHHDPMVASAIRRYASKFESDKTSSSSSDIPFVYVPPIIT